MKPLLLAAAVLAPQPDDELTARLAALLSGNDPAGPGAVLCVVRAGELVASHAVGVADVATGDPITMRTPFYIASLAKTFTATTAVLASSSGELDLDASVTELFPELPEAYAPATLRHLVHHASGIPDVYDTVIGADLDLEVIRDNRAAITLLTALPRLCFEPGERFLYCNSGYVLLAEALERATGRDLASWARATIFGPAGMSSAGFVGEEGLETATSYEWNGARWSARESATALRGPGGMVASAADLLAFERAWRTDAFGADLRRESVQAPYPPNPAIGPYGAGWMLQRFRGLPVERHFGGAFGFTSDFRRFPEQDVTILALSNSPYLDASELVEGAAEIVLTEEIAAAFHAPPATPDHPDPPHSIELGPDGAAAFGRFWREPESGHAWVVTVRADTFVLATLGDFRVELAAVSATRLESVDAQAPIAAELRDGNLVIVEGRRETLLEEVPFRSGEGLPRESVTGAYTHAELDAKIELVDGPGESIVLVQKRPLVRVAPFQPLSDRLYLSPTGAQVELHLGDDERVVGLTMHANRSWNLEFVRESE